MPVVREVATRDPLKSTSGAIIRLLRDAIAGVSNALIRHKNNSATEPALEVWQEDATSSAPILWARYLSSSGTKGVDVTQSGVTLRSPNGSNTLAVTDAGVVGTGLAVGLHEVDGSLVMTAGAGVSTGVRAANTAALAAQAALGSRILSLPPGTYEIDAVVLSHALTAASFGIQGVGYGTILKVYGTTGPLIDWAGTAANAWRRSFMKNLVIDCGNAMTGGALIRLKTCKHFLLEDIWIRSATSASGPWTAIQVGETSIVGVNNIPEEVHLNRVKTGLVSPSTGAALLIYSSAGVYVQNSDLSGHATGGVTTSTGVRFRPNSIEDTDADTWGIFDTAVISNTLIKDHVFGIDAGTTGGTNNVQVIGGHIDGIGRGATTGVCVNLVTQSGTRVFNFQCSTTWLAQYATTNGYGYYVDNSAGGTLAKVFVEGGYITGCKKQSLRTVGTPSRIHFNGVDVEDGSVAGQHCVEFAGGSSISCHNNTVAGTATSGNCGYVASGVTDFNITGNHGSGKTSGPTQWVNDTGGTSATKIFDNNH